MTIHREGYKIIFFTILILLLINIISFQYLESYYSIRIAILGLSILSLIAVLQFFRSPKKKIDLNEIHVLSPADGKVVAIEEVVEDEFYHEKRLQLSIFMSPLNVHSNLYPVSGSVKYFKYHPGKYLVAWHPKSSSENERTTVVINTGKDSVLVRQIAGAVARRIVCYAKENLNVVQGEELGFIKFGSRVDVFLPLSAKVNVKLEQKVT
ncbi:MAG: phosphatidylserine decarboxylase family protein, partial [Bacteroidia bacterium]|nr:phosphatidylserine decarboxylase family protein [Bacteroidia bacterium]